MMVLGSKLAWLCSNSIWTACKSHLLSRHARLGQDMRTQASTASQCNVEMTKARYNAVPWL